MQFLLHLSGLSPGLVKIFVGTKSDQEYSFYKQKLPSMKKQGKNYRENKTLMNSSNKQIRTSC